MRTGTITLFFLFFCFVPIPGSADSIQSIPISGVGEKGQPNGNCCFNGDFFITGPNLFLQQITPDGPTAIGACDLGEVCDFSYFIGDTTTFCTFCTGFSYGSIGGKIADYLDPSLAFTGSAFYSGANSMTVPVTVSGMIVGYQLNCTSFGGCTLGPVEFRLRVVGQGEAIVTLRDGLIWGSLTTFTGTATVVPEPMSLVLVGTGLAALALVTKRHSRSTPVQKT